MADKQVNINITVKETGIDKTLKSLTKLSLIISTLSKSSNMTSISKSLNKIGLGASEISKVTNSLKKMNSQAVSTTSKMNKLRTTASKTGSTISKVRGHFDSLHGVLIGLISINMIRRLKEYADGWIDLTNSVKLGVKELYNISPVMEKLYDIAQRTRTELDPISKLFRRMSLASDQLGASYKEMLQVTETITKALKISGSSTNESARAIEQLAQAFSEGVIKAKDFRSIISQAPRIIKALADELTKGDIGKLKTLLGNDAFTIKEIFGALLAQSGQIDKEFTKITKKFEEGFTVLENAFKRYIGQIDAANGLSNKFATAMEYLAKNVDVVAQLFTSLALVTLTTVMVKYSSMLALLGGTTAIVALIVRLYVKSKDFRDIINSAAGKVLDFAKAIKKTYTELTTTKDGISKVNKVLGVLETSLDDIAIGIGSIIALNFGLKIKAMNLGTKLWSKSLLVLKGSLKAVKFAITKAFPLIAIGLFLAMLIKIAFESKIVRKWFNGIAESFNKWIKGSSLLASMVNGLKNVWNAASQVFEIFAKMSGDELFVRLKHAPEIILAVFSDIFDSLGDPIKIFLSGFTNAFTNTFEVVFDRMFDYFDYQIKNMKGLFKDFIANVQNAKYNTPVADLFNRTPENMPIKPTYDLLEDYNIAVDNLLKGINKDDINEKFNKALGGGLNVFEAFASSNVTKGLVSSEGKAFLSQIEDLKSQIPDFSSKFATAFNKANKNEDLDIGLVFMQAMKDTVGDQSIGAIWDKSFEVAANSIKSGGENVKNAIIKLNTELSTLEPVELKWKLSLDDNSKKGVDKYIAQPPPLPEFGLKLDESWNTKLKGMGDNIGKYVRTPFEEVVVSIKEGIEALKSFDSAFDELFTGMESGLDRMADEWSNMTKSIENWTMNSFDKMGDAMWNFFSTGKTGWRDLASSAIQELNKILFHKLIGMMFSSFNFGASNSGGAGFSLSNDNLPGLDWVANLKGDAIGGSVSAGSPRLVGESGPELWVPNKSGQIVTNNTTNNMTKDNNQGGYTIINSMDPDSTAQAIMNTPTATKLILNIISANKRKLGIA